MNSLQTRLRLGLTFSLMLLLALVWWAGSLAVRELGEDLIVSRLEHDAESLVAAMEFSGGPHPQVQWKRINPIYNRPLSGHYFIIHLADDTQLFSRSLWDQGLAVQSLDLGSSLKSYAHGPSNQELLIWAKAYEKQGQGFTLAVAEDISPLEQHLSLFQWTFAGIAVTALIILLIVQQQVITSSLRRLDKVRNDICKLEQGEIGTLSEDVPLEILPLVQEFNRLLELLAQRLERSRNALGNLAHALKAPLNLLIQYLDSDVLKAHPDLRTQAQTQTERIQQLMERELKRARLAGSGSPGQRFNPNQELPILVGVLKQVHHQRNLEFQLKINDGTPAFGDREDMLELMGNLLDNACKWAKQQVRCSISGTKDITIRVEDDGPGGTAQELDQLTQRGVRLDESVEGHGLGLAIAKDIVKLYGGAIHFDISESLGGLRVTVNFYQSSG